MQILHWRKFLNGEFYNLEFSSMEEKEDYSSKENIIMETNKLVRRIFSIGERCGEYSPLEKGEENILHWRTMLCYLVLDKNRTSEQY